MEQFLRLPREERHLYFVQTAERLRLVPAPVRAPALAADYDRMREMFFGERPAFAEVLRVLGEWEAHFNRNA